MFDKYRILEKTYLTGRTEYCVQEFGYGFRAPQTPQWYTVRNGTHAVKSMAKEQFDSLVHELKNSKLVHKEVIEEYEFKENIE